MMRPPRFSSCPALLLGAILCSPGVFAAGNYLQAFSAAPASWTNVNGGWSVTAGDYRNAEIAPGASAPDPSNPTISFYTGNNWTTNYTFDVKALSEFPNTGNQVGVVFGYVDSTHYYQVMVNMNGDTTLDQRSGGSPVTLASGNANTAGAALAQDTWFNLQLFVNGTQVSVRVNGKLVIEPVTVSSLPNAKVGLISRSDKGHFDDFKITDNLAKRLFRATFTGASLAPAFEGCSWSPEGNCYKDIVGTDGNSGDHWPIDLWGGDGTLQFISRNTGPDVTTSVNAAIVQVPGHVNMNSDGTGGDTTYALQQKLIQQQTVHNDPQIPIHHQADQLLRGTTRSLPALLAQVRARKSERSRHEPQRLLADALAIQDRRQRCALPRVAVGSEHRHPRRPVLRFSGGRSVALAAARRRRNRRR